MATAEFAHVARLNERLTELGADPFEAMALSRAADRFHEYTAPDDWYEGLIKAYVGDGLANDSTARSRVPRPGDARPGPRLAGGLGAPGVRGRPGARRSPPTTGWAAGRPCGALADGEALTQAQRVTADRDAPTALLAGGVDRPGLDLAAIGRMFTRITERHAERMAELGLRS